MANSITTQIMTDGSRNTTVKIVGFIDTSNIAVQTAISPASLVPVPVDFLIERVQYVISDTLQIFLEWHGTPNVSAAPLSGRGVLDMTRYGGLPNNATTGKNGVLDIYTLGWAAAAIQSFTLTFFLVKRGVVVP